MEGGGGFRRGGRERSPDRARVCMQPRLLKPMRKVQVVYYLTRNGHLEHPHYMEVTLFANHHLRLRDVMDRLTALRGKGMPMLYSWSCKRSYKSGYVWNDLSENDIILPAEGAEYVLKGSEIIEGCSEKFQQLHVSSRPQNPDPNFHEKRKPLAPNGHRAPERVESARYLPEQVYQEEEEEEEYEDEEKTSYTSSTTPHSRCSRGVSTDELEDQETHKTLENSSCPPLTSSTNMTEKTAQTTNNVNTSKRFEDGDPVATVESAPSRNSVLLQLIACGSSTVAKAKNVPSLKPPAKSTAAVIKSSASLQKGAVCRSAVKAVDPEDRDFITYMSENPRFGNLQCEEKEYFSGSIVLSMSEKRVAAEPVLKKSNSYNEERGYNGGALVAEAVMVEEEKRSEKAVKGKCMPRKKSFSSKQTKK